MTKYEAFDIAMKEYARTHYPEACRAFTQGYDVGYKDALAQPAQEPVAYWNFNSGFSHCMIDQLNAAAKKNPAPLYTEPPQRPWVGLTYEDMVKLQKDLYDAKGESVLPTTFAMAVEAKLKEKNT